MDVNAPYAKKPRAYVGRFAPSPTGPLHFGSLVAAVASYLDARHHGGEWLVRIDDLDPPREVAGAADSILQDLDRLGMIPDRPVVYQSAQHAHYAKALQSLLDAKLAFPCACARRDLPKSGIYPGTCANGLAPGLEPRSIRLRVGATPVNWLDRVQGHQSQNLASDVGAFVIRRADGLFAYQLAVAVDDARAGVTHIVRGADLAGSTPRQIHLQRCLGYQTPSYAHLPVALDHDGKKLGKSTGATAIDVSQPAQCLATVWRFLVGSSPPDKATSSLEHWWSWATERWSIANVPAVYGMPAS